MLFCSHFQQPLSQPHLLRLPACVSVCLTVCLPACVSAYLTVCLPACFSVFLTICLSGCVSVSLTICLPVCNLSVLLLFGSGHDCEHVGLQ